MARIKRKYKKTKHSGQWRIGNTPANKGRTNFYHYEDARKLVRAEALTSMTMYAKWWQANKPARIPLRADSVYRKQGWLGWNDYLGNNNKFGEANNLKKKNWLPWEEARAWARTLGLESKCDWTDFCQDKERKNRPPNIPYRPDLIYSDDWYTWNDWLGVSEDIKKILSEAAKIEVILFIIKTPNTPSNVYKVNVTQGGRKALDEAISQGAKVLAAFEYTKTIPWRESLVQYAKHYWLGGEDDYAFTNVNGFLFDIAIELTPVKL